VINAVLCKRPSQRHAGLAAAIFLILLSLTVVLLMAGSDGASDQHRRNKSASGNRAVDLPVITRLQDSEREAFRIFRSSPERLPFFIRHILRRPIYGLNWSLSQRLPANDLAAIWAVPGNQYICLVSSQKRERKLVGVTCDTVAKIARHGLFTAFLTPLRLRPSETDRLIVGIAQDSARLAQLYTGRQTVMVQVHDDVFVRRDHISNPPDQVIIKDTP